MLITHGEVGQRKPFRVIAGETLSGHKGRFDVMWFTEFSSRKSRHCPMNSLVTPGHTRVN